MRSAAVVLCLVLAAPAAAEPANVNLPLEDYNRMVESAREVTPPAAPAPARFTLGTAEVTVAVSDENGHAAAQVQVELPVRVLQNGWTAVPLLANGTAVSSATSDGHATELLGTADGLAFVTERAGSYTLALEYEVDAQCSAEGCSLALPTPPAPSLRLQADLPGKNLDAALIPASAVRTSESEDGGTSVSATVPTTRGLQLSWRLPREDSHQLSRARYRGQLEGDAVRFQAELTVELQRAGSVILPLLPRDVTLSGLTVDGKPSSIALLEDSFGARVGGQGVHRVQLAFEVNVIHDDGPPRVALHLPEVPVSELEISLPGDNEVTLSPAAHVTAVRRGGSTLSRAFLPMTDEVEISWAEAVPEEAEEELLANANIFHLVHAEEGVLYVRAMVVHEVVSGHTNVIEIEVPAGVQVSEIRAEGGGIKQAVKERDTQRGGPARYRVFLDRELRGELSFDVFYERKLKAGAQPETLAIPVIKAANVSRQRGMIALLASKELTLNPVAASEQAVTRVGENQLPAFVRKAVDKTIAHTYKYIEDEPKLEVVPAPPERKQGKFDAQVDTLISLSDVTLKGSATVEINVKSGGLETLGLRLPAGVNFLGLTAPSLRTHTVKEAAAGGPQLVEVQFTQQMEGQFRLEVSYEKIISESEANIAVPTLLVDGAEVEQGRVAVEALSAVEVGEAGRAHLSPLDPNELPQQLVLKTTNPILRAYKYVQIDPPYTLALRVTRHKAVDVQRAAIDEADYRTLYTRDGLAVTTATFRVRNSREQFLKLVLPRGAKVWSAFVAGRPEKPAIEAAPGAPPTVLIKIINSTEGFPVELIYEVPSERMGALGRIRGQLPRPDMVVTRSRWDVYLPDGIAYGEPDSNMERSASGATVAAEDMRAALGAQRESTAPLEALRIEVPTSGVRYAWSKLYANRSAEPAAFSIPYSSRGGAFMARLLAVVATFLFWIGVWFTTRPHQRRLGLPLLGAGASLGVLALGSLGAGITWPLLTTLALLCALGLRFVLAHRPRRAAA